MRESVLSSGLAPSTPGPRYPARLRHRPGSGDPGRQQDRAGTDRCRHRRGVDSISDPPIVYPRSYQQLLLRSYMGRSAMARIKPFFGLRPRHFKPVMLGVVEPRTGLSMGQSMELTAQKWHVSRAAQDELAYESHLKAAAAWKEGFYEDLVVPFRGLATDNNVRADTSPEKLAKLRPVFDLTAAGTLTAGNSTSADRRRQRRAAGIGGVGAGAWVAGARVSVLWQGMGGRLRERRRRSADGAGLCRSGHVERCRTRTGRLRLLRTARGLRGAGADHPGGLGIGRILPGCAQTSAGPWAASTGRVSM